MKTTRHFLYALFLMAVIGVLGAGCKTGGGTAPPSQGAGGTAAQTPQEPASISVRADWLLTPAVGGQLIARDQGIFTEHGLDVDIQPGGLQSDPIRLVASGSNDIGWTGADAIMMARAQGIPIVAFAGDVLQSPVVFLTKPGIKIPEQFVGRKVGVVAGNHAETIYKAMMSKVGVDRTQVQETAAGFDPKPFATGEVDVWPVWASSEPYPLAREGVQFDIVDPADYGVNFLGKCFFATEKTIAEKPEVLQAFVDSVIEGWELAYADPEAAAGILAKYDESEQSAEYASWVLEAQGPYARPEGRDFCRFTDADWQALADVLREQSLLEADLDLSSVYTTRFVDAHYAEASTP